MTDLWDNDLSKTKSVELISILDKKAIEQILRDFSSLTRLSVSIVDATGAPIINSFQNTFCVNFHRANPDSTRQCRESDRQIFEMMEKSQQSYILKKCLLGLYHAVTPIRIREQTIGFIIVGQFFLDPPDEDYFKRQADQFDFEITAYLDELKSLPVFNESEIEKHLNFLAHFAEYVSAVGAKEVERHDTIHQLHENQVQFETILEQSTLGIMIFQDGQYKYINQAAVQISEYTREEVLAWREDDFFKMIHPDDMDYILSLVDQKSKTVGYDANLPPIVYRAVTKNNSVKWIEQYIKLLDYNNAPAELYIIIDVTERMRAEEERKRSEEKYRNVVDNAIEGISIIQDDHYRYVNPQATKIFGYSAEEMASMTVNDAVYPDDRDIVERNRKARVAGLQKFNSYEHRIVAKDGTVKWVEIKAVTIEWNDSPATLVFFADITEKKHSEELIIQTEKMISLGRLAAGMAHEINNPLAAITQSAQNITRRFSPELKPNIDIANAMHIDLKNLHRYMEERKIIQSINIIRESGIKASQIIVNMLQFSRKSQATKIEIDLIQLVEQALQLVVNDYDFENRYDVKNINIIKEFDTTIPLLFCSPNEIEQVLLNLIKNAAQATRHENFEGSPQIIIRIARESRMARIEVEDNGRGMDEDTRLKVFEPFFTTKSHGEGTGLGLSVSHTIITVNHGGSMEVESKLGHGAKFIIRLPFSDTGQIPNSHR